MLLLPCGSGAETAAGVPVKNIDIHEKQTVLLVGASDELASAKLTYSVKPENAGWQDVTWESSNEKIATVSADGTVVGVAPGKVSITAHTTQPDSKVRAVTQVTVQQAVTGIELDSESVRVPVKKSVTVKSSVSPKNAANKKQAWASQDESIAKVSAQGTIQGISAGDTVITAASTDGSGLSVSCRVTVYQGHYENMVFDEFEEDRYLTDLPEGYEITIGINASIAGGESTDVDADVTDWDSWTGETP